MRLYLDRGTWKRVTFGDVVRNLNVTVRDAATAGIDRVIAMEHLDPGELKISRWGSPEDGTTFTRRVRPGQTLFGKRRAYQRKAAYAEFDAVCSSDILVFQADPTQLLPEFLPFIVRSNGFYGHALGTSAGSLSPRTNWHQLAAFEFNLPPLDDQQRIADLLWALERHSLAIKNYKATLGLQRLSRIDAIVDEWIASRPVALSSIAEIRGGVQKGKAVAGDGVERPYLRVANVQAGYLDLSEVRMIKVSPSDADRFALRTGDVLMTEGGDLDKLGRGTVWKDEIHACLHQNHLFAVRVKPDVVLPEWVSIHTESSHGRRYFLIAAKRTSNLATVNKRQVSAFTVGLPPPLQQRLLLNQIRIFDEAIRAARDEACALRKTSRALMTQIFKGSQ